MKITRSAAAGGVIANPLLIPNGTAALPALGFINDRDTGLLLNGSGHFSATFGGTERVAIGPGNGLQLRSNALLAWSSGNISSASDTILQRDAANVLALVNSDTAQTFRLYCGNGGYAAYSCAAESHTLAAATTSATTDFIPAGAKILGVATRITTAITAASGTTFDLVVNGGQLVVSAGIYTVNTTTASPVPDESFVSPTARGLTFINRGGAFTAGVVRVQVYYVVLTAPTS